MARYAGKKRAPFYGTGAWRRLRQAVLERDHCWCQVCKRRWANTGHHVIPIKERPDLALDMDNCEAICDICHNQEHPEKGGHEAVSVQMPKGIRVIDMGRDGDGMG